MERVLGKPEMSSYDRHCTQAARDLGSGGKAMNEAPCGALCLRHYYVQSLLMPRLAVPFAPLILRCDTAGGVDSHDRPHHHCRTAKGRHGENDGRRPSRDRLVAPG